MKALALMPWQPIPMVRARSSLSLASAGLFCGAPMGASPTAAGPEYMINAVALPIARRWRLRLADRRSGDPAIAPPPYRFDSGIITQLLRSLLTCTVTVDKSPYDHFPYTF